MPIRCIVTAACVGYLTGWRQATKSLASHAVLARMAWRENCCSPHRQRSLNAQVSLFCWHGNITPVKVVDAIDSHLFYVSSGDVDSSVLAKCNPCLSSPCLNQGICHSDLVEIYRCSCPPGFKVRALNIHLNFILPNSGAVCIIYSKTWTLALFSVSGQELWDSSERLCE